MDKVDSAYLRMLENEDDKQISTSISHHTFYWKHARARAAETAVFENSSGGQLTRLSSKVLKFTTWLWTYLWRAIGDSANHNVSLKYV